MECPHCGGAIEVVAAKAEPDRRQAELPFVVGLRHPTKSSKKVVDAQGSGTHAGAPAPEHDHVHEHKFFSRKHEHDHDGGKLTPAQQDLLSQIDKLVASENRSHHFRTTWIMRIRDYPNQVFAAIGEARTAKREGRVRKSVGGVLNWHFEKFRAAARQRKSA